MHGVNVTLKKTVNALPAARDSGIPLVFGAAPVQAASKPAPGNMPVLVRSFTEFTEKFGYSDDWADYNICEMAYSHFAVYGCAPLIVINALDPTTMNEAVSAADLDVAGHCVKLPIEALDDANLVVKPQGGTGTALVKGEDYTTRYDTENGKLIVTLLPDSDSYSATKLNIAYKQVTADSITNQELLDALEAITYCATAVGIVPDMIVCPGHSKTPAIAQAMLEKAKELNGLFACIALIDLDASTTTTTSAAIAKRTTDGITDHTQRALWPKLRYEGRDYWRSTAYAGIISTVDAENGGYPERSVSNRLIYCDANVLEDGSEVFLTMEDCGKLNDAGIITGVNFLGGFKMWGNCTAAYPDTDAPEERFASVDRMMKFLNNGIVKLLWDYIDQPLSIRDLDNIMNKLERWLSNLVTAGHLNSANAALADPTRAEEDLRNGVINIALCAEPPSPLLKINVVLSYGTTMLAAL